MQTTEITKAVFRWAYDLGESEAVSNKLLIFGLREKIAQLEKQKNSEK